MDLSAKTSSGFSVSAYKNTSEIHNASASGKWTLFIHTGAISGSLELSKYRATGAHTMLLLGNDTMCTKVTETSVKPLAFGHGVSFRKANQESKSWFYNGEGATDQRYHRIILSMLIAPPPTPPFHDFAERGCLAIPGNRGTRSEL